MHRQLTGWILMGFGGLLGVAGLGGYVVFRILGPPPPGPGLFGAFDPLFENYGTLTLTQTAVAVALVAAGALLLASSRARIGRETR